MAKKALAPTTTSPMPAMGKNGPPVRVRTSSSNVQLGPRDPGTAPGSARSYGMMDGLFNAHRTPIQERMGATLRPTATISSPNAPEAHLGNKNVKLMPSSAGTTRDFWAARTRASAI